MRYLTLLLLGLVLNLANGQVITVLRNGQSFFHYDVSQLATLVQTNSATYTLAGDTIILPGGTINTDGFAVSKPLTFVGAGALTTGTPVTGATIIEMGFQDYLSITSGATGSSFHGIDFHPPVRFSGTGNDAPSFNTTFVRCVFNSGLRLSSQSGFGYQPAAANVIIRNCVVRSELSNGASLGPVGFQASSCFITCAITLTGTSAASNTAVDHCVILGTGGLSVNAGVQFANNIFTKNTGAFSLGNTQACYTNNLFATQNGVAVTIGTAYCAWNGSTTAANADVFQNVTDFNDYNANFNYHPQPAYQSYGVYSGADPWKEDAIPFNPHWNGLLPLGTLGTTNGGTINVTIQGEAQQN